MYPATCEEALELKIEPQWSIVSLNSAITVQEYGLGALSDNIFIAY